MSEKNYGNDSQIAEIVKYISDNMKIPVIGAGGGFAPLGFYAFSCDYVLTPPQGWLFADGSIYNIADYPEYAALLASQHGRANIYGGDGITTFATKDLRGEFIRGWGQNSHENQGSGGAVGVHQDSSEFPALRIDKNSSNYTAFASNEVNSYPKNSDSSRESGTSRVQMSVTASSAESSYFTIRPTNTSVAFFVKATLSDAEINAFNVYTPREHQVGWWEEEIDGVWKRKPVYEKTIDITLPNQKAWTNIDTIQDAYDGWIVQLSVRTNNTACVSEYGTINMKLEQTANGTTIAVLVLDEYRYGKPATVTVRYTKTTDDWQTS